MSEKQTVTINGTEYSEDQLSEADVLGWVWGSVDKAEMEANLAAQIEAAKAPATASGLPWAA